MPQRYSAANPQRAKDFFVLLQHGWDLYLALAALEEKYGKAFSLAYALAKQRAVEEARDGGTLAVPDPLPKWVKAKFSYKKRAEELKIFWKQKTIEDRDRHAKSAAIKSEHLDMLRYKLERTRGKEREEVLKELNVVTKKIYAEQYGE